MNTNDSTDKTVCGRWLDAAPFTEGNRLPPDLAKHMDECESCRREWIEMRAVWEALAMDADEIDVPEGLKEEVMSAVFAESKPEPSGKRLTPLRVRPARWSLIAKMAAVGAACLIAGAGLGMFYTKYAADKAAKEAQVAQEPMQRGQEWKLVSYDTDMPQAEGTVAIVRQGDSHRVVVDVSGLKATTNDQAYQVWLIHDGERMNCGTFRVNEEGKGTLVYYLHDPYLKVNAFGITLEPDALGTQPRGKKVAGTAST